MDAPDSGDLRMVAVFFLGIAVGVCVMLFYMAARDSDRHIVNPGFPVRETAR